jgi:hypothetical protein
VAGKPKGGKRPGAGAPPKMPSVNPDAMAELLIENALSDKSAESLKDAAGISERAATGLKMVAGMAFAEYQEKFREDAQALVLRANQLLAEKLSKGEGSMGQLTMLAGVYQDKLSQQKAAGPQSLHLHLHGKDRDTVLKQVMGRDTERIMDSAEIGPIHPKDLAPLPAEVIVDSTPTIGAKDV